MAETKGKRKPGRPAGSKNKSTSKRTPAKGRKTAEELENSRRIKDEISAIISIALGAFLVIALQTSTAGAIGSTFSDFFKGCFGFVAFILPYHLIIYGILLFLKKTVHMSVKSVVLLFIILLMLSVINSGRFIDSGSINFSIGEIGDQYIKGIHLESGGFFGMLLGDILVKGLGKYGLYIFAVLGICICLLLLINTPVSRMFEKASEKKALRKAEEESILAERETISKGKETFLDEKKPSASFADTDKYKKPGFFSRAQKKEGTQPGSGYVPGEISKGQKNILKYMKDDHLFDEKAGSGKKENIYEDWDSDEPEDSAPETITKDEDVKETPVSGEKLLTNKDAANAALDLTELNTGARKNKTYKLPPIDLLHKSNQTRGTSKIDGNLKAKAAKLEKTLSDFHVDARVVQVTQGPAVTRYEIHPSVGVKVNSIVRLADDIALNMEARSIRIEAPIPGKAAVGIEVENEKINMVTLRDIIASKEFKTAKSKITFAVGRDIAGKSITADLKEMPHLLIAGSTGSGKSVCVNSIITSILYKARPEEVKLILIDPKVVELSNYNGISHLLIPVVTDPKKSAAALNWATTEMDERYRRFAEEGVKDLGTYNIKVSKNGEHDKSMPQIVIIIDELADLMMEAPSQVEDSICRIAQKARAAGMHLIVATQRPSVDVITGVIKANIPSRIAFTVSSQVDSRTILDMSGAEKLVGKGDMLFSPVGSNKPIRVQGTFVSDDEVHDVIRFVKEQSTDEEYSDDIINSIDTVSDHTKEQDEDELLKDAIETVVTSGQASVSMLQRRFRIGYNRAARIVDMMEARNIIGPADGSRPRQVIMTEEELHKLDSENQE